MMTYGGFQRRFQWNLIVVAFDVVKTNEHDFGFSDVFFLMHC